LATEVLTSNPTVLRLARGYENTIGVFSMLNLDSKQVL